MNTGLCEVLVYSCRHIGASVVLLVLVWLRFYCHFYMIIILSVDDIVSLRFVHIVYDKCPNCMCCEKFCTAMFYCHGSVMTLWH